MEIEYYPTAEALTCLEPVHHERSRCDGSPLLTIREKPERSSEDPVQPKIKIIKKKKKQTRPEGTLQRASGGERGHSGCGTGRKRGSSFKGLTGAHRWNSTSWYSSKTPETHIHKRAHIRTCT